MHTRRNLISMLVVVLSFCISFSAGAQSLGQREANAPEQVKRQLREMRQEIQRNNLNYSVGYTAVSDRTNLRGGETDVPIPREYKLSVSRRAVRDLNVNQSAREKYLMEHPGRRNSLPELIRGRCSSQLQKFNWQDHGKVTPVKDQGNHPTCWAFAATAAFESSYSIVNGDLINVSEQFVINGVKKNERSDQRFGWCYSGEAVRALEYYCTNGSVDESAAPYTCNDASIRISETDPLLLKAVTWKFVGCDSTNTDTCDSMPTVQQIKQALCEHGPLVSRMKFTVRADGSTPFVDYKEGIYSAKTDSDCVPCSEYITHSCCAGHAVLIVGWDDTKPVYKVNSLLRGAWRIKNSWGTEWGEQGFAWVAYGSSAIGKDAAVILAANKHYRDPRIWQMREVVPLPLHPPLPLPGSVTPATPIRPPAGH